MELAEGGVDRNVNAISYWITECRERNLNNTIGCRQGKTNLSGAEAPWQCEDVPMPAG